MSIKTVTSTDPEFLDAGKKEGIEIWRIENFKPVKCKKQSYGTFYSGDSYLILHTSKKNASSFQWNIHYWLGVDSTPDEYGTCAIKAIELDDFLGGRPIQYREVQYHESDLFLSYFKANIRYLSGGFKSGFNNISDIEHIKKLYMVKGKKNIRLVQVPFHVDSLNKDDVFILDNGAMIYQWNPPGANKMEKINAAFFSQKIKDDDHSGKSQIIVLEEDWERNRDFWSLINGSASQIKDADIRDEEFEKSFKKNAQMMLYKVSDSKSTKPSITLVEEGILKREMLDSKDCFIVDAQNAGIYCWIGSQATIQEKKATAQGAQDLMTQKKYPNYIPLTSLIDGGETTAFKALFSNWTN